MEDYCSHCNLQATVTRLPLSLPPAELRSFPLPLLQLREIMDAKIEAQEPWFGFEQEYTMLAKGTGRVFGWPASGFPTPQVRCCPAAFGA